MFSGDCDDGNANIYPGAYEVRGNGVNDDCYDGEICYLDDDNDGYRPDSTSTKTSSDLDCDDTDEAWDYEPIGDCDDRSSGDHPGATEIVGNEDDEDCNGGEICYRDDDNDGYRPKSGKTITSNDTDCDDTYEVSNSSAFTGDCDDSEGSVHPNAEELCNGVDDNCVNGVDEGVKTTYYLDNDGDGYGLCSSTTEACDPPTGYVDECASCDDDPLDNNASIHPGADEVCDNVDNDCAGGVDDGLEFFEYYPDLDGDGYGSKNNSVYACEKPDSYVENADDCDDSSSTVGGPTRYYRDGDADGFPNEFDSIVSCPPPPDQHIETVSENYCSSAACPMRAEQSDLKIMCLPPLYTCQKLVWDCDDVNSAVYPHATESCDGLDNDCDGSVDEVKTTYYRDNDSDGYGTDTTTQSCSKPSGYATQSGDCNDNNAAIHPGATDICGNSIDEDCSGSDKTCPSPTPQQQCESSGGDWICIDIAAKVVDPIGDLDCFCRTGGDDDVDPPPPSTPTPEPEPHCKPCSHTPCGNPAPCYCPDTCLADPNTW